MPTGNLDPLVVKLTARRRQLGISQTQLGLSCGFSNAQIPMYESGRRNPDVAFLRRWAAGLGMVPNLTVVYPPAHPTGNRP